MCHSGQAAKSIQQNFSIFPASPFWSAFRSTNRICHGGKSRGFSLSRENSWLSPDSNSRFETLEKPIASVLSLLVCLFSKSTDRWSSFVHLHISVFPFIQLFPLSIRFPYPIVPSRVPSTRFYQLQKYVSSTRSPTKFAIFPTESDNAKKRGKFYAQPPFP